MTDSRSLPYHTAYLVTKITSHKHDRTVDDKGSFATFIEVEAKRGEEERDQRAKESTTKKHKKYRDTKRLTERWNER